MAALKIKSMNFEMDKENELSSNSDYMLRQKATVQEVIQAVQFVQMCVCVLIYAM